VNDLIQVLREDVKARKLFHSGQSILVAVSGGSDSMVLLHLLHRLSPEFTWQLVVAHFNHRLRGAESQGDEQLVRATAAQLRLPCVCEGWDGPNRTRQIKEHGPEMAARVARHDFLGRTATRLGIPTVAMAHHADDQVELFFLRLFRGAGGEGLSGMKWTSHVLFHPRVSLVRPLLEQSKAALQTYARKAKIAFHEDATNARPDLARNWIRHKLLPLLRRKFGPSVLKNVLRTMDIVGTDADYAGQIAQRWLAHKPRAGFVRLHSAVQRHAVRIQLQRLTAPVEFDVVEHLRQFPNRPLTLSPACSIYRDEAGAVHRGRVTQPGFDPAEATLGLTLRRGRCNFDGVSIAWQISAEQRRVNRLQPSPRRECFDADKVGPRIRLRHWRRGDRFQPIGMARSVKLQDLFTNRKMPSDRRRTLLVAESLRERQIFWVEGLRISESFKLDKQTRRRLKWEWHRD
jgi:tRNA(Ile)-lysidine synthase